MTETLSEPMQRALDALLEGRPAPLDTQNILTPEEMNTVAALARTARLTRFALQHPEPSTQVAEAALQKAQTALAQRPPQTTRSVDAKPGAWWAQWWKRSENEDNG